MAKSAKTKPQRIPANKRTDIETNKAKQASAADEVQANGEQTSEQQSVQLSDEQRRRFRRPMRRLASKILYFVNGHAPTIEEYEEAMTLGANVVFRNARKIVPGAPLENCDAVAGAIPDDYAEAFETATADFKIDPAELPPGVMERPVRSALNQGNAPDDVRPGTVDTGKAHASGTGAEMEGVAAPKVEVSGDASEVEAELARKKAAEDAWRQGRVNT